MNKFYFTYNYDLLNERIKEKKFSQETLAPRINMSRTSLNLKLNNKSNFKQKEILAIAEVLDISNDEVGKYFFNAIVHKTVQSEEVS